MRIALGMLLIIGCNASELPGDDGGHKDMGKVDARKPVDQAVNVDDFATVPNKHVFATTALHDGNLGGLTGADALCATAAAAQGFDDSSTWTAWLSTTSVNAIDRIPGNGPWMRFDETMVFANRAALQSVPSAPVTPGAVVLSWSGTALGGHATAFNCANWTSNSGAVTGTFGLFAINTGTHGENWTDLVITQSPCGTQNGLLCFEN